ncbi:hypothetical protein ABT272_40600 [Streptomyces sp900105245]|uniref:Uncharacterized protein n=1 Tax=Streptomyces sp. 900105245 TaxID=3154379 RepID=A0ABV1UJQ4_9ACTN
MIRRIRTTTPYRNTSAWPVSGLRPYARLLADGLAVPAAAAVMDGGAR